MTLQAATAPELIALLLRFELAEPLLLALKEKELVGSRSDGTQSATSRGSRSRSSPEARSSPGAKSSPGASSSARPSPAPLEQPASPADPQPKTMDGAAAAAAMALYCTHHQLHTEAALTLWCFRHALSPAALLAEAHHLQQRQDLSAASLKDSDETLFLRFKDRLDRVLYGLIRVESEALARDLFFAIEAGELRFGEAARRHSCGPEARTEGIVGPVDLATPHLEISSRLRAASAGELIPPFRLEQWHIILRLDYRFEATFDPETRQFLRDLAFRSQLREAIEPELDALASWVQDLDRSAAG